MNSLKLLAQVYKEGLAAGIFDKYYVIAWSDKVIGVLDEPPYEFIEISLMGEALINDIERKLIEFYKEIDINYVAKLVLAIIYQKLLIEEITIEKAIRTTAKLLLNTSLCFEEEFYGLYYCDDAYDLALEGVHHSLKEVIKVFKKTISVYHSHINDFQIAYKEVMGSEWT